ncbi:MAG TPA: 3-phosphoglycerate dehydrogenase [Candidatus Cloacimonadota bacterium]|nr:3-phosphoglycerate dehydrogenase [Candidatus Cloacimonadota bacterium]HPT70963.1 3-phosphoglycerate dehydrogenase [Candidatus Cloacimonadota bacterium]
MSKKVLIATEKPFAKVAVDGIAKILKDANYEMILLENYTDKNDLLKAVADVDAMIVRSDEVTADVVEAAKNLKIVVRAGAGFDNLDLKACTAHDIVAMNTPGQNSNAVAELAFGMMIYIARKKFSGKSGYELRGKKIGIHAYGAVGRYMALIAKGFGMEIFAYDPFVPADKMKAEGVTPVTMLSELYEKCDYVSLHLPLTESTNKSINYDLLSKMPKSGTLINTARKEIIHEDDLKKVMEEKGGFKYISDIAPGCAAELEEKYPERVFFTPKKSGAQTEEANINAGLAAARQIVGFLEKGDKTFQVNK